VINEEEESRFSIIEDDAPLQSPKNMLKDFFSKGSDRSNTGELAA
jgi:hypothetical protein